MKSGSDLWVSLGGNPLKGMNTYGWPPFVKQSHVHRLYRLRFDIHCKYWKSTVYVTYTIDFQYWQWISKRSLCP